MGVWHSQIPYLVVPLLIWSCHAFTLGTQLAAHGHKGNTTNRYVGPPTLDDGLDDTLLVAQVEKEEQEREHHTHHKKKRRFHMGCNKLTSCMRCVGNKHCGWCFSLGSEGGYKGRCHLGSDTGPASILECANWIYTTRFDHSNDESQCLTTNAFTTDYQSGDGGEVGETSALY